MTPFALAWMGCLAAATTPFAPSLRRIATPPAKADTLLWHQVMRQALHGQPNKRRAVFVRAADVDGQAALARLGIHGALNAWIPAQLDAAALSEALQGPAGLQLRSAPAHRPLNLGMADSVAAMDAPSMPRAENPHALTGRGVLVGFVDTGLDLHHPAFHRPDGSSRVVAVWDQDATDGPAPAAYGYGRECTEQVIAAGACPAGDPVGHGTHVAGIAAGGPPVGGVAYEADIAVVSSSDFTRLADAVAYLEQVAADRQEPLVINVSVGGQYGPHDGRTPLEIYLDQAVGPGRVIVAAAGNDGAESVHIATQLSDVPVRVALQGLPVQVPTQTLIELWTDQTAAVEVTVEFWLHGVVRSTLALPARGNEVVSGNIVYDGAPLAAVTFGHHDNDDGLMRHALVFDRSQATFLPDGGMFVLRLRGSGAVQGWISQSNYNDGNSLFAPALGPGFISGDGARSIAVPATAQKVVAVGSYTVRTHWNSQNDGVQTLSGATIGGLSSFSSQGPTGFPKFTGFKPDLVAPGSVITSARAASVPTGPETLDSQLMVMQGTSMASPHVAGVVALMLQADPTLDGATVRDILRRSARSDAFTGATPNNGWGFGKLDAVAAITFVEMGPGGCTAAAPDSLAVVLSMALWFGVKSVRHGAFRAPIRRGRQPR